MAALAVIALAFAWATQSPDPQSAVGVRPPVAPTPTDTPVPTPTPVPTSTPVPTPTPTPEPVEFDELVDRPAWVDLIASPLPTCTFLPEQAPTAGADALTCAAARQDLDIVASADGRVVHVVREQAIGAPGGAVAAESLGWSWVSQQALGPHVVIDHGPLGDYRNVQTVYAGLDTISAEVMVGYALAAGDVIGTVTAEEPTLLFSVWADDVRQDGASSVVAAPPVEVQREAAEALRETIGSPTDERCPLVLAPSQLPGASRSYRNGTHRGIDFGCGAADRTALAIADGEVVYLVDDYDDPSVGQREALLANAGRAGFTPHWTLTMLYGNVVVIDHGIIDGAGRVVTIAAHLESVDPAITLGSSVTQGQPLGEIGNRGTNASAVGIRGGADPSLHLHWELFVDGWYMGAGLDSPVVAELITTTLCGNAQTTGCPG